MENRIVIGLGVQNEAGQRLTVLPRECNGHSKHPLPTTQGMTVYMDITRCSIVNQIDYIICSQRWRSSKQSAKTRPGADCGSDLELLIAKFRLKLKKVGKTTESAYNSGDLGLIPGSGRSPGEGNGNPLQYSCLENTMDRDWQTTIHGVAKSWRPFRYDLKQIPYDYTVGVTTRFKGVDLIDRVPEELWT